MKKVVHCLGVVVVDALSEGMVEYPVPRTRPQVNTRALRFSPGGGAANTASALALLGIPAAVFSKVGSDVMGRFAYEELQARGIDVAGLARSEAGTTPFTYVGIHPDGERTFVHTPGVNLTFTLADIDRERLLRCDMLLYQDLWVLPGIDGENGAHLLAEARQRGVRTLLDECWGYGPNRAVFEQTCRHADYVLPSFDDLAAIYPGLSPGQMVAQLHKIGADKVVLKLGQDGCLVSAGAEPIAIASEARQVVDTTGAGDCFDAGFIAGLAHGLAEVQAARIGSLAAAACIQAVGGARGIPSFADLAARL